MTAITVSESNSLVCSTGWLSNDIAPDSLMTDWLSGWLLLFQIKFQIQKKLNCNASLLPVHK